MTARAAIIPPVILFFLVLLVLIGCGGPGSDLPLLPGTGTASYNLGPGDQVRIITFAVHAAGLTSGELEAAVAAALRRGNLVHHPSVAVEVIAYRPIYVLGEVNKPGQYAYQPGMTVVTAAAVAGGFTYRAVEGYAAIVRSIEGKAVEGRASRQAFVQPGDVITMFERRF